MKTIVPLALCALIATGGYRAARGAVAVGPPGSPRSGILSRNFLRLATLVVMLAGCDAVDHYQTTDTERLLATAGFRELATDDVEVLPQHELIERVDEDGRLFYQYADAQDCRCIYVGDAAAYAEYQKLEGEKRSRAR